MFNTLMKLLNDYDFSAIERRVLDGFKDLNLDFTPQHHWEESDSQYVLTLKVDEDATTKNVTVDFDDENQTLSIDYHYEKGSFKSRSFIEEILPVDADADSINATIEKGQVVITVDKKKEEVKPEEPSSTVIKVNRKK